MVRPPYFDINGVKKGAWSKEEDNILRAYVERFGHPNWRLLPFLAGIPRCGKSCRLRWMNYLKPGLKRGKFTKHEEDLIIKLHDQLGNKWSAIAAKFPGRTDNEIKNYWHAHIEKRGKQNGKVMMPQMELEQSSCDDDDEDDDDDDDEQDEGAVMEDIYVVSPQSCLSDADNMDAPNPTNTDPFLVTAQVPHQAAQSNNDIPIFEDQESYDFGLYMINDIYSQPELLKIWSESLGDDTFVVQLW